MARDNSGKKLRIDSDGVRIETSGVRPGVWLALAATLLVGIGLIVLVRRGHESHESDGAAPAPAGIARNDPHPAQPPAKPIDAPPAKRIAPLPERIQVREPTPPSEEPAAAVATVDEPAPTPSNDEGQEAPMFGPITPGEKSGIALFPPPGTKPIKRGILVPEDFELPPGYVRHYQATDDGERVPAILMFHPDYQPVDEHGVPIPLPPNRVVPPEMAPPGMPIQMLELPENPGEQGTAP